MSELIIDVSQLPDSGTIERKIGSYQSAALADIVKAQVISITFSIQKLEDEFLVQGTIEGFVEQECSCCLEPARWDIHLPFAQAYTADQTVIDIEPEIRDTLLTNLPEKIMCRTDCKGLCVVCGKNKNTSPCECQQQGGDIRLSKLKDFFKK